LTSALAVENFLPQGDTSGTLSIDSTDPTASTAGVFAGQLTAAKLNVTFDDAGLFDSSKNGNLIHLGDLILNFCVDEDLVGISVRQLITIADRVISGEFGSCLGGVLVAPSDGCQTVDIYDVDNDGIPDVSIDDLSHALDVFNKSFDNCEGTLDCLGFP
jgi:hypothetical protein